METADELRTFLTDATRDGVKNRLLYRGAAWALMREEGVLPENAPPLGATIETDLAEQGFSILRAALALREKTGPSELSNHAFERAANAFEALVRNGNPTARDRGFLRAIAAAAYHLAGYSAVGYSLFNETDGDLNPSPAETAVMLLMLRDLDRLRTYVRAWLVDVDHSDSHLSSSLGIDLLEPDDAIATILNTTICRAIAFFDFALQTGSEEPLAIARDLLLARSGWRTMPRTCHSGGSPESPSISSTISGRTRCTSIYRSTLRQAPRRTTSIFAAFSSLRYMRKRTPK